MRRARDFRRARIIDGLEAQTMLGNHLRFPYGAPPDEIGSES
jgi:hypothetical protein